MPTYNHEAYVAQAIEGVLAQQADFPIELVIGEDCSTDNTRSICSTFAKRHPEVIVLLAQDKNLGLVANGRAVFRACRGQYLAMCEGDDYWTDPRKLQKQADLLDKHPSWSGCFHRTRTISEGQSTVLPVFPPGPMSSELTFEVLSFGNRFHT